MQLETFCKIAAARANTLMVKRADEQAFLRSMWGPFANIPETFSSSNMRLIPFEQAKAMGIPYDKYVAMQDMMRSAANGESVLDFSKLRKDPNFNSALIADPAMRSRIESGIAYNKFKPTESANGKAVKQVQQALTQPRKPIAPQYAIMPEAEAIAKGIKPEVYNATKNIITAAQAGAPLAYAELARNPHFDPSLLLNESTRRQLQEGIARKSIPAQDLISRLRRFVGAPNNLIVPSGAETAAKFNFGNSIPKERIGDRRLNFTGPISKPVSPNGEALAQVGKGTRPSIIDTLKANTGRQIRLITPSAAETTSMFNFGNSLPSKLIGDRKLNFNGLPSSPVTANGNAINQVMQTLAKPKKPIAPVYGILPEAEAMAKGISPEVYKATRDILVSANAGRTLSYAALASNPNFDPNLLLNDSTRRQIAAGIERSRISPRNVVAAPSEALSVAQPGIKPNPIQVRPGGTPAILRKQPVQQVIHGPLNPPPASANGAGLAQAGATLPTAQKVPTTPGTMEIVNNYSLPTRTGITAPANAPINIPGEGLFDPAKVNAPKAPAALPPTPSPAPAATPSVNVKPVAPTVVPPAESIIWNSAPNTPAKPTYAFQEPAISPAAQPAKPTPAPAPTPVSPNKVAINAAKGTPYSFSTPISEAASFTQGPSGSTQVMNYQRSAPEALKQKLQAITRKDLYRAGGVPFTRSIPHVPAARPMMPRMGGRGALIAGLLGGLGGHLLGRAFQKN